MLEFDFYTRDEIIVFSLKGEEMDENKTDSVNLIKATMNAKFKYKVVLDFTKVRRIDSHLIGMLIAGPGMLAKQHNGQLKIVGANGGVRDTLRITKLEEFFGVYDSVDDAIESFDDGSNV